MPAGTPRSADSGFDLTRDAFTFENFAVGYDASRMTPELAARMFGVDKVCTGTTSTADYCETSLGAQGWIDSVNASLENGRCEGLAVMSQLLFLGDLKAQDFGAGTARDLTLARNFDLQRELAYWFSTQLVPGAVKNQRLMPREVLPFLAQFLKAGATESYRIGMVQKLASGFGLSHSLTPIGYYAGSTDGLYFIRVYDNNFPGAERAIKLDLNANTWSYDGVSSQGPVSFTGGAANKNPLYFAPVRARKGALPCPFCEDAPAKTVLVAGAIQVAAKDMAGNTNGVVGGEVVESNGGSVSPGFGLCIDNQCSDGSPLAVINAPSKKGETLKLSIQPGDPTMMQAGTNTVRVGGDSGTVTISGIKPKAGSNDEVTIANGGKTVDYKSDSKQPVTVTASFVMSDGSRMEVSVAVKGGSSGVQLDFDPATGKVSAKTTGAEGTPITVSVSRNGGLASGRAEFTVTGSADGTVSFSGHDINRDALPKATVQNGSAPAVMVSSNSCITYVKDGEETDADCGGPTCAKCRVDQLCKVDGDCLSGVCRSTMRFDRAANKWETANRCMTSCDNQKKDADETDVDCGGSCSRTCDLGKSCKVDKDCGGGRICRRDTLVCDSGRIVRVTSTGNGAKDSFDLRLKPDGAHDEFPGGLTKVQQETIVAQGTGGFYSTRIVGPWSVEITRQPRDGLCTPDVASGDVTGKAPAPIDVHVTCQAVELQCENGKKDGQESDVDCGGAGCRAEAKFCGLNKGCATDADCGNPSVKLICGGANRCIKAYDVFGDVEGLAAGEQVTVRLKGTLTDPNAYREAVVVGKTAGVRVDFALANTRATGVPVSVEVANAPAGKTCAQLGTGTQGSLAISTRVKCVTATPVDLCADGKKGENETDIDCGGAECRAKNLFCGDSKGCAADADCNTGTTKRICSGANTCRGTFEIGGRVDGDYDQLELGLTPAGSLTSATMARTLTIPVKANPSLPASFKFEETRVTAAETYGVTITKAPTNATCTLTNATGQATAHVTNVVVTCVPKNTSSGRSWAKLATTGLGGAAEGHNGVFNAAADDVFALGAGTVRRFDGATWSDLGAGLEGLALYGMAGTGPDSIWVTCESNILKYWNGAQWFAPLSGLGGTTTIHAIAVNSTIKQAYLVGTGGAIAQGGDAGQDFTDEFGSGGGGPGGPGFPGGGLPGSPPPTSSDLYGVWLNDSGRVFAVGDAGALVYKAGPGGLWQASTAMPTTKNLRGVWASGDSDAWAVGAGGTIVHFDGGDWTVATSGVTDDLHAVWGASKDMVWAAGANGRVLFYDGKSWLKETSPSTATLRSISGRPGDDKPYVIGDNDTFMRRQ